jgi:hypothetical protein
LDPSIYLMNEESGGFGSGAVQMKALPSAPAGAVAAATSEKDGKGNQNPEPVKDSEAGEF